MEVSNHIRLTQDKPSQTGWLWSKIPFLLDNFVMEFEFRVHGKGSTVFGDGFAFWITKGRATPGPAFGNKQNFEGLGLFFDTYANSPHRVRDSICT